MQAIFFDAEGILSTRPHLRQRLRRFLEQQGLTLPAPEQMQEATQAIRRRASCGLVEPRAVYEAVLDVCGLRDRALRDEGCQARADYFDAKGGAMESYAFYAVLCQTSDGTRYWCGVRDPQTIAEAHRRMVLGPVEVGLRGYASEEDAFAALMLWHGPHVDAPRPRKA